MKLILFVFLAGYAVRCDDSSNYYVIQMPDDDPPREIKKSFKVYWNVPTMQCRSKKIPFENLFEKFGIIQNENDDFRGGKIAILYDPGVFPALLKNATSGKFVFRNGGVPQEGNLEKHLASFRNVLDQSVTDPNFSGVGIIDFESWRPVFRQNFGVLLPYKDVSYEVERNRHWWWPDTWIQTEAKRRFEEAARLFMQNTLSLAKQMRPNAIWGYYGFPYCFNVANSNKAEHCADKVPAENDKTYWLWSESTALYPSVYSSQELTSSQLAQLVRGRVSEAARVSRNGTPILPYFWFRYRDAGFLSEVDLQTALKTLYKSQAAGFIIWGSSNDVNTPDKCNKLLNYIEKVMGPAIAKYTKNNNKDEVLNDDDFITDTSHINDNTTSTTTIEPSLTISYGNTTSISTAKPIFDKKEDTTVKSVNMKPDPEFYWDPPENYTQDIHRYVEEEFKKSGHNISLNENKTKVLLNNLNDSLLLEKILDSIFNKNNDSELDSIETDIDEEESDPSDDILRTILVYNPPTEDANSYGLETSTYLGTDSPLLNKKNHEEQFMKDSSTTEVPSTTIKVETTTYTTENYEQTTEINDDNDYKFYIQNTLFDLEHDYINSEIDNTDESDYRDITTAKLKDFPMPSTTENLSTTEDLSTTETSTDFIGLYTSTDLAEITTEVSNKTRIPKSTNGSAVTNEEFMDSYDTSSPYNDQVTGSASNNADKYFLCILFFYSVKCLFYGQC